MGGVSVFTYSKGYAMRVATSDYARVERAIEFISSHSLEQPSLRDIAETVGLSEFHFQRLFVRWAGVSPKRFMQFLTLGSAKALLRQTHSVLETSLALGLSGPSRLHDLFLTLEHLTPGEFKSLGRGLTVKWGIVQTELGPMLLAVMERGLCAASFIVGGDEAAALRELASKWQGATMVHDVSAVAAAATALRTRLKGAKGKPLSVVLKGTPLQIKVWEALLRVPPASVATYGDVAKLAGSKGVRAVASAVGQNPIAWLIPCHRVIQSTGAFGEYHWGATKKVALLARELGG